MIAARTGLSTHAIRSLRCAARVTASLDEPVGEDATPLGDLVADERAVDPFEIAIAREDRRQVSAMLRLLPTRHREVLERRYGLGHQVAQSHQQIGQLARSRRGAQSPDRTRGAPAPAGSGVPRGPGSIRRVITTDFRQRRSRMSSATLADQLIEVLLEAGVERIYGVVGDSLNPLVDAVRRSDGIEWVHVRNEEAGRVRGRGRGAADRAPGRVRGQLRAGQHASDPGAV